METVKASERSYQVGNIIKIIMEPRRAKLFGFTFGTEHVIQNPPKEYKGRGASINSHMGVWLHDKNKALRYLSWEYFIGTAKIFTSSKDEKKVKRVRRNA